MSNSENKHHVTITFNQKIEGIQLTLVDGTLETIYSEITGHIRKHLSPGIYKLIAKYIDYTQEYPLIVDSDKEFLLDFNYPSVAPILSFVTTHEYFHQNAEEYSKFTTVGTTDEPPTFFSLLRNMTRTNSLMSS